jgi:hypothetical protein
MLNYYFPQFIKKIGPDQTEPNRARPVGVRPPGGQRWDGFGFFKFGPSRTDPYGPYGIMDCPGLD